jgi:hypothetical protein
MTSTVTEESRKKAAASGDWAAFFHGYKLTDALASLSLAKRTAFVLDWAAKRGPGVLIPANVLYKYVMGFSHTPRLKTEDVERFRANTISAARPVLQGQYKRDLKIVTGVGCRATTDSLDVVKATLPANVRRVNSAHAGLERAAKLVDPRALPEAGPDKGWTEWFGRAVSPALKALAADERIAKLLPPAPDKAATNGAAAPANGKPEGGK